MFAPGGFKDGGVIAVQEHRLAPDGQHAVFGLAA
jgi:hypothetical protein